MTRRGLLEALFDGLGWGWSAAISLLIDAAVIEEEMET
jgi:hypothetical protein